MGFIMKILMTTSVLALLISAQCQAADQAAQLSISGNVRDGNQSCSVTLDRSSIELFGDMDSLINQSETIKVGANVRLNVASDYSEQSQKCRQLAAEGKLAYRFIGQADNADGTSLANMAVSPGAAKGIGVGLYNNSTLIRVNTDTLQANDYGNTLSLTMVKLNGQAHAPGKVESALTLQFERF